MAGNLLHTKVTSVHLYTQINDTIAQLITNMAEEQSEETKVEAREFMKGLVGSAPESMYEFLKVERVLIWKH